jgi:hypothetical protein
VITVRKDISFSKMEDLLEFFENEGIIKEEY